LASFTLHQPPKPAPPTPGWHTTLAPNGSTHRPVRRAQSRNTSGPRRAFQSAVSCSTISRVPHGVGEPPSALRPAFFASLAALSPSFVP
jgi:hypothetical protein